MFLLALFSLVRFTSATDVLVLGDSWAAKSLTYLADYCVGKTVLNGGVDQSTAGQWAAGSCVGPPPACSAVTAFQGVYGVKSVWFSIGGNDFIQSGCTATVAQMSQVIGQALAALKRVAAPTVKILMTGYCTPLPTAAQAVPSCNSAGLIGTLNDAISAACQGTLGCTFVDAVSACGGSRVAFSQPAYFQDAFHMNQLGYKSLFSMPGVQTALSCGVAASPAVQRKYIAGDVVTSEGVENRASFLTLFLFACTVLGSGVGVVVYRMRVRYDTSGGAEDAENGAELFEEYE